MSRLIALLFVVTVILFCPSCEQLTGHPEEKAIRENAKEYEEAFNKQDAKKLASLFAEDGVYVDSRTGDEIKGKTNIEQSFIEGFGESGPIKLKLDIKSIKFKGTDQAIESGTALTQKAGEAEEKSSYRVVYKRVDGKWLISEISEIDIEEPVSHYEQLKGLEWMVGTWVDKDDDSVIELNGKWDKYKNFLNQKFTVTVHGREELEGLQIIGWDPVEERIRSWVFDSDGGFAEGKWEKKNGTWVVESVQTMPGGEIGTAINIYSDIAKNTYTWESTGREVGGTIMPNIGPVTVKRK